MSCVIQTASGFGLHEGSSSRRSNLRLRQVAQHTPTGWQAPGSQPQEEASSGGIFYNHYLSFYLCTSPTPLMPDTHTPDAAPARWFNAPPTSRSHGQKLRSHSLRSASMQHLSYLYMTLSVSSRGCNLPNGLLSNILSLCLRKYIHMCI